MFGFPFDEALPDSEPQVASLANIQTFTAPMVIALDLIDARLPVRNVHSRTATVIY
jgi:hypothetical protein